MREWEEYTEEGEGGPEKEGGTHHLFGPYPAEHVKS